MTLFARWVKIVNVYFFKTSVADSAALLTQKIASDKKIEKPDDPIREEYNFLGWYTTEQGNTNDLGGRQWNFDKDTIGGDNIIVDTLARRFNIDLYAHWTKMPVITFHSNVYENEREVNTGLFVLRNLVTEGSTLPYYGQPDYPARAGYTFDGWSQNKDNPCDNKWADTTRVTQSIDLYACWRDGEDKLLQSITVNSGVETRILNIRPNSYAYSCALPKNNSTATATITTVLYNCEGCNVAVSNANAQGTVSLGDGTTSVTITVTPLNSAPVEYTLRISRQTVAVRRRRRCPCGDADDVCN
jgi:uncharacterized repeat protein (TIGR02543 family)